MSEAPVKRSRRGAQRDSDDDETPAVSTNTVNPTTNTVNPTNTTNTVNTTNADSSAAVAAPPSRRARPRAAEFTSEAVAAAGQAANPNETTETNLNNNNLNNNNNNNNMATPPPPPASAAAAAPRHADPSAFTSGGGEISAAVLFQTDFDRLTFSALRQNCLLVFTRQQVEAATIAHLQSGEAPAEEELKRVEKFPDVSSEATLTTANAIPNLNSNNLNTLNHLNTNGSSSSSSSPPIHHGEDENVDHRQGYTYGEMLTRLYEQLNRNQEGSALVERNQVPVPVLEKIGKKKTVISNFARICEAIHRPTDDVKDFIEKELAIRGNLDSNNALILKYQTNKATDFDRIFIKYLDEYVKCNSCHRIDTTLTKEGRRLELRCNWCTATRTVTTTGTATYQALVEKRSKQRAAAAMTL